MLPYNSRLVLRDNYGQAEQDDALRAVDGNPFRFGSTRTHFNSKKNAPVAQLLTNFTNGAYNELILGYTTHSRRASARRRAVRVDHGEHGHHAAR